MDNMNIKEQFFLIYMQIIIKNNKMVERGFGFIDNLRYRKTIPNNKVSFHILSLFSFLSSS